MTVEHSEPARTRKAVVSYALADSSDVKRQALLDGMRDCAAELLELGESRESLNDAIEQLGSDVETGCI
ncbi:MAG TPA: hypothetical protein VGF95_14605 [Solirubrobacteraceae bacterium]|jgi:hypothetical protein